jgi:TRAP-type uncharacterized transport system fused permease subunit
MSTGFAAMRFGWTACIAPVLFVCSPSLLLIGGPSAIGSTRIAPALRGRAQRNDHKMITGRGHPSDRWY